MRIVSSLLSYISTRESISGGSVFNRISIRISGCCRIIHVAFVSPISLRLLEPPRIVDILCILAVLSVSSSISLFEGEALMSEARLANRHWLEIEPILSCLLLSAFFSFCIH